MILSPYSVSVYASVFWGGSIGARGSHQGVSWHPSVIKRHISIGISVLLIVSQSGVEHKTNRQTQIQTQAHFAHAFCPLIVLGRPSSSIKNIGLSL